MKVIIAVISNFYSDAVLCARKLIKWKS